MGGRTRDFYKGGGGTKREDFEVGGTKRFVGHQGERRGRGGVREIGYKGMEEEYKEEDKVRREEVVELLSRLLFLFVYCLFSPRSLPPYLCFSLGISPPLIFTSSLLFFALSGISPDLHLTLSLFFTRSLFSSCDPSLIGTTCRTRITTHHHAAPRSTTQHHAASRSTTHHHASPRITTHHHASPRSTTHHHAAL